MKNNKRSVLLLPIALGVVLVLVLSMVLFLNTGDRSTRVGVCLRQNENREYSSRLNTALKEAGYRVSIADAGNDQSRQMEQISRFVKEKYDLLIVEPVMVSTSRQLAAQIAEAEIPTVFVNYEPQSDALNLWEGFSYVGCEEQLHGYMQGQLILQTGSRGDINGDGAVSYLVITGPEDDKVAQLQAAGCANALEDAEITTNEVAVQWGQWTRESGRKQCADALAQYGKDVEVIFCGSDQLALGALEAVWAGGWNIGTDFLLVGVGGTDGALQAIRMGHMTGTVVQDMDGQVQQVLAVAEKLLKGESVEKQCYVNCTGTTQQDLEEKLSQSE